MFVQYLRRYFISFFCLAVIAVPSLGPTDALAKPVRIVVIGDSLTAGYRLDADQGFVPVLEKALRDKGIEVTIVNGSVSGDTTAGGRSRLEWALGEGADAVILELGANDALRGLPVEKTKENLRAMMIKLQELKLPVLLAGMQSPRNMDQTYQQKFNAIYPALAKSFDALLYPFFLEGVALEADLNLDDGLHPNPAGVKLIVAKILPLVEELLGRIK